MAAGPASRLGSQVCVVLRCGGLSEPGDKPGLCGFEIVGIKRKGGGSLTLSLTSRSFLLDGERARAGSCAACGSSFRALKRC